jgi:hypothetical protein
MHFCLRVLALWLLAVTAQAQLQVAGSLLVDLRANDLTTFSQVATWTNHGTAGDFAVTGATQPTVAKFFNTRGVYFDNLQKGMLCANPAPAGLMDNSDWTVEFWIYGVGFDLVNPGFAIPVVAWGDRPGFVSEIDAPGLGSTATLYYVTFANGDESETDPVVLSSIGSNVWHHLAVTYTPQVPVSATVAGVMRFYVNGVLTETDNVGNAATFNALWPHRSVTDPDGAGPVPVLGGAAADDFGQPNAPLSVGGVRDNDGAANSWGGNFTQVPNYGINRVRIHDGVLSDAQITTNYNLERAEFVGVVAPQPKLTWRNPTSGRVINFGDLSTGTSVKPVSFKNIGGAPMSITSYTISGGSQGQFATTPAIGSLPTSVAPGQTISFDVTYTPASAAETLPTSLTIVTSIGTAQIALRANVARKYVNAAIGDDTNPGTQGAPFFTLNGALTSPNLRPGDVIEMANGTYSDTSAPNLAAGSRQFRVVGNGSTIIVTQNLTTGFTLRGSATPLVIATPNVFPQPSTPQVYEYQDNTAEFENLTFDATQGTTDGDDEPFRIDGSGTFSVSFTNCRLWNAWGTAAFFGFPQDGNFNGDALVRHHFVRLTALNSEIRGLMPGTSSDTDNNQNASITIGAEEFDVVLNNCDIRGGENGSEGNIFHPTVYHSTITMNNCLVGATLLNERPIRPLLFNVGGGGTDVEIKFTAFNTTVADWVTDVAVASSGRRTSLDLDSCTFNNALATGATINITSNGNLTPFFPTSRVVNSIFGSNSTRHINLPEGYDITLSGNRFAGQRGAAVAINGVTNSWPTTVTVTNNIINGGTTTTSEANPVGILSNYTDQVNARYRIDGNTFYGVATGNTTPSQIQRASFIRATGGVRELTITNNIVEGSDFAVTLESNNTPTTHTTLVHNTIIGLSDNVTSVALRSTNTTSTTAQIANNVILNYPFVTNVATPTFTTNRTTYTLALDPGFISPNPFTPPAGTGIANYQLTPTSSLKDVGTLIPGITLDRIGTDRTATPGVDIGAYEFNPTLNPVRSGWEIYYY